MGILTIQFGQCGNQIGHSLFEYILNDIQQNSKNVDYVEQSKDLWFSECKHSSYYPRSVLVDTENKVISSLISSNNSLKFNNVVAKCAGGSANNWALGFTKKGDSIVNEVVETVRKEMEKSTDITSIVSFLGSGGGTGSGTGSRILESLRNNFPNKTIINVIVLPYKKGEVVTQSYNTLLTLAKLHDLTDGSIIFENDSLHSICNTLLSINNVDLSHMNSVIAQKLAVVFQPIHNYTLHDFVFHLMPHPNYKFVQIKTTPHIAPEHLKYETSPNWTVLCGHMRNVLRANNQLKWETKNPVTFSQHRPVTHFSKSVANLLISRGGGQPDNSSLELLRDKDLYCGWVPDTSRLKHFHQTRPLYQTDKFLALSTNNNSVVNVFDPLLEHAWMMYNHKAYLHQYAKYEITENEFEIAFEKMEYILSSYKEL